MEPAYDPAGRSMLIIPFRDPAFDYFESEESSHVADYITYYMEKQNVTPVTFQGVFPPELAVIYKKHEDRPATAWQKMAEAVDTELVLTGTVNKMPSVFTRDDQKRGSVVVSAALHDMTRGGAVVWRMKERKVTYPQGWERDMMPEDLPSKMLKNRVLRVAAEAVAKSFHEHPE
jgi:hypothetical protein